jgi:hypothetical protein
MKLTNRQNLPQPLVDAVANDGYSRGASDISITQLIAPPQKVALEEQHKDDIEEDVSDRIYSLLGQSIHTILERATTAGIAERRLSIKVRGWVVSGAMDYYTADGLLQDYKLTTVWKFKNGQVPMEFEQQLNMLAEILRENGEKVARLQIVGILRDWSKMEAQRDADYPQSQVVVRNVELWPSEQAKAFIAERVEMHQAARKSLPECTPEERWAKPDMYAVMKPGGKRALKLHTSIIDATQHASSVTGGTIVKRPGESTRCKSYCAASKFCSQYQKELKALASASSDPWAREEDLKQKARIGA